MIPLSHLSFVQCEQVKFRPKTQEKGLNKDIPWCYDRRDRGGSRGGGGEAVKHDINFISAISLI